MIRLASLCEDVHFLHTSIVLVKAQTDQVCSQDHLQHARQSSNSGFTFDEGRLCLRELPWTLAASAKSLRGQSQLLVTAAGIAGPDREPCSWCWC